MPAVLLLLCLQIRGEVLGSPHQPLHSWGCCAHNCLALYVQVINDELEDETERKLLAMQRT